LKENSGEDMFISTASMMDLHLSPGRWRRSNLKIQESVIIIWWLNTPIKTS
jgi:hypothetical protein